jgi:hypothetical protein
VGHASRYSGLLHGEANQLGFLSLTSRLADVRWRVMHVEPSQRSHEDQVEDGRIDVTATSDHATLALPFSMY